MWVWELLLLYRTEATVLFVVCTLVFVACQRWLLGDHHHHTKSVPVALPSTRTTTTTTTTSSVIQIDTTSRSGIAGGSGDNAVYLTRFHVGAWTAFALHTVYGFLHYFASSTNIYYLCISAMLVYEYRDARAFTQVVVLVFFALVAMVNHVRATSRLLVQQHAINHAPTHRLVRQVVHRQQGSFTRDTALVDTELAHCDLRVGDLIRLEAGCAVPADILLLDGTVLTQELQLTGENIVLGKSAVSSSSLDHTRIVIRAQAHANEGVLEWTDPSPLALAASSASTLSPPPPHDPIVHTLVYTARNMVFRGTDLVDKEAYGIVVEAGNDCAIYRLKHDRSRPPTAIQKRTDRVCITNLYLMLLLSSCTALMIYDEREEKSRKSAWVVWALLRKMLLLFNTLVPLSHQLFFSEASRLLSRRIERAIPGVTINRGGLMAFQNDNARWIVSDKTGTVTTDCQDLAAWWRVPNEDDDDDDNKCVREFVGVDQQETRLLREGLYGALACTEVQPHSTTGRLLKSDPLEERLLTFALERLGAQLVANHAHQVEVRFHPPDEEAKEEFVPHLELHRVLLVPFSHAIEAKLAVTRSISHDGTRVFSLHVQGTPEAIQRAALRSEAVRELLEETITKAPKPESAYRRVIAYGRRWITAAEAEQLHDDPEMHAPALLQGLIDVAVYVFHDHTVPGVDRAIGELTADARGCRVVLLTGDKASAAQEIGTTIGLVHPNLGGVAIVESCEDLLAFVQNQSHVLAGLAPRNQPCLVLNGRLVQERVECGQTEVLRAAIMCGAAHARRLIVFRASPTCKQMLVSLLQAWYPDEHVLMVREEGKHSLIARSPFPPHCFSLRSRGHL
jgi:magnesium-transporting ATPase (P-type)